MSQIFAIKTKIQKIFVFYTFQFTCSKEEKFFFSEQQLVIKQKRTNKMNLYTSAGDTCVKGETSNYFAKTATN